MTILVHVYAIFEPQTNNIIMCAAVLCALIRINVGSLFKEWFNSSLTSNRIVGPFNSLQLIKLVKELDKLKGEVFFLDKCTYLQY